MFAVYSVIMFVAGLVFLVGGSGFFVDSAVTIARKLRVSEVLIGATLVSLGTTLPEILFSVGASFQGYTDMALGNALGSILCNTGFIAGVLICVTVVRMKEQSLRNMKRNMLFLIGSVSIYIISGFLFSGLPGLSGCILLLTGFCFLRGSAVHISEMRQGAESGDREKLTAGDVLRIIPEVILVYVGARFLLEYGPVLARLMGVPEVVISLTFVAAGTSLPELVTSLVSLAKRHASLSLGNILGADILNLVFVGGLSAVIRPIVYEESVLILEIPFIIILLTVLCVPVIKCRETRRWQGVLLIGIYGLYLWMMFNRNILH